MSVIFTDCKAKKVRIEKCHVFGYAFHSPSTAIPEILWWTFFLALQFGLLYNQI